MESAHINASLSPLLLLQQLLKLDKSQKKGIYNEVVKEGTCPMKAEEKHR